MRFKRNGRRFLAVLLCMGWPAAWAQSPHQHGHATLQMAVDGQRAEVFFESPAANIIGFEHEPKTQAQRDALNAAIEWFESNAMVNLEGGGCELVKSAVEQTVADSGEDHGEEEDHHDHGHDDHDHHDEETGAAGHSQFTVSQVVSCDRAIKGASMTAAVMAAFQGIESLDAAWVTDVQQGSASLAHGNTTLDIAP